MGITIIKGKKDNGVLDTEHVRTPVLVTELIHDFPKMCEADIEKALRIIRRSAERDAYIHRIMVQAQNGGNNEHKKTNRDRRNLCIDRWTADSPGEGDY